MSTCQLMKNTNQLSQIVLEHQIAFFYSLHMHDMHLFPTVFCQSLSLQII